MAANAQLSGSDAAAHVRIPDLPRRWIGGVGRNQFQAGDKADDPAQTEFVGVLRDVTERKRMEDELTLLNRLLTQLAATDGLTGLTNRRTFDAFLRREYDACEEISVLLFDIDTSRATTTPTGTRPVTAACRPSPRSSAMRPRIRRAFPRAMAAKNSPSCCRTPRKRTP